MTDISFERCHDTFMFNCCGHTNYSVAGADILCSAVSVLCYTLADYLEKKYCCGEIVNYFSHFGEGCVSLSYELSDTGDDAAVSEGVNAILAGFALLYENFPDHINADI